ncbi:TrkH family potassium uptake protein [Mycoplasma corogypsi]|uniref:TrkH family potassium uptake protein n=1 Tax=Mycoplasma corogypsi TaxID=2106 RepID=UPI00387301B6
MVWKRKLPHLKYLFFLYFVIVIVSSLLLFSPWTQNENNQISYIDAVFTTASAFSDTGLVVVNTFEHWNWFGQAIIAVLILSGGIGIFALKFFIINYLFGKKSATLSEVKLLQTERGSDDPVRTTRLVINSVKFLFLSIFIFSIILTVYFYFSGPKMTVAIQNELANNYINPKGDIVMSLRFGIFHTISAINNAGFDIISGNSLMPYYSDYFLQVCFIILLIIGGLGYPAIYDIRQYIRHKIRKRKNKYHFSLFTKVSLTFYLLIFLVGFVWTLINETTSIAGDTLFNKLALNNTNSLSFQEQIKLKILMDQWNFNMFKSGEPVSKENIEFFKAHTISYYGTTFNKVFAIFFTSLSTRSAGFATANLNDFTKASKLVYTIMMVIGSAPASTGGGIRTTTFAVFMMSIISTLLGQPRIRMFKRAINKDTVFQSLLVVAIALVILTIGVLLSITSLNSHTETGINARNFGSEAIIFEVASAFGTTGLSTGITTQLNTLSKITIIVVMFIGQFGISSTLLVWKRKKDNKRKFEYIDGDLAIG